jgi:hypothetical protein
MKKNTNLMRGVKETHIKLKGKRALGMRKRVTCWMGERVSWLSERGSYNNN